MPTKPDLLGYMLSGVDRQSGERLDDVNIRYQMNTFLIAGHETTSGMLSFAIYFLLNNPHVLQKAYEEVDRVLGRDINAKPTAQQVNQLVYIGQILKESLRLWPTAPAFGLYPYQNETIGGKYKLRKRTFVTVLTAMLHRDQSVWGPRAEVFDPENFAPEREAKMPPHAYKPFGNGQRACIGRQFAMTEATLVLGLILQRFRLIDHTRYQLKIKESLTIKPEGLMMRVKLRPDVVRGSGVSAAARPAPKKAAPKKAAKSHGTKLTVLFGSNMGTAEELARSIADSGEAQGFETTLAGLDDHAGKLPTEGAVAIVCASYNGGPPDNAGAFIKSLRDAAPGSLSGVRYTVFGCGNRDWASTYQAIPRQIDELLAAKGAERIYVRGEGDAKEDLDGHFQAWNEPLLPALADKLGVTLEADAGAAPGAALPGAGGRQAAGQSHHRRHRRACRCACWPTANCRSPTPRAAARGISRCCCPTASATAPAIISASCRRTPPPWSSARCAASPSRPARMSCWRRPRAGAPTCRSARRSPSIACCRTSSSCSIRRRASRSRPWRSTRAVPSRGPSSRRCSTRSASAPRFWPSASRCSTSRRSIRPASCRSRRSWKCCR